MLTKILWEMFSVALLLYGLYLVYAFIWFSIYRIYDIDISVAKFIAGSITLVILAYSSYRWFRKKSKEIEQIKRSMAS
ncbi:MAG: hypothetical protein GXO22_02630 [Aquificae bacterium]|nr:hypothetical protein [Aquificota bacterium]